MLRMKLFVFPSEEGFCFAFERGRRGEAPAGFGSGRSPEQAGLNSGIIECLRRWLPPSWCASYAGRT
jgi:hypothetical protein